MYISTKKISKAIAFIVLFVNFSMAQTLLDEVIVTANKTEQKLSQTGKVVIVLSDSLLQKCQGLSVAELLARQAGFTIAGSNGQLGSNQDLYLRGASVGNTLIMVDGTPIYDPSTIATNFDLNLLNVCECERIEILKGAQSTLYGSDAVAGVINIFTKKGIANKPFAGSVSSNVGSFGTFRNTLNLNGMLKGFFYNLQYTNLNSLGISAAESKDKVIFEKDAFKQNNFLLNIGYNFNEKLNIKVKSMANNYKTSLDAGPFIDEKDYATNQKLLLFGFSADYKAGFGKFILNYNWTDSRRVYVDDSTFIAKNAFSKFTKSTFGGVSQFADLYFSKKVNKNVEFIVGADLRIANSDQTYLSFSEYGKYEATPIGADTTNTQLKSIYFSGLVSAQKFYLDLGGRFNIHSLYGSNFTYSANPSIVIIETLKAFINISTGFKAPSLYQLFSPYGNKILKPEFSKSAEIGFQLFSKNKKSNARVLYFARNQKDVIYFQSLNVDPYGKYINFDKQNDNGVEIEASLNLGKANIWGNYTYVNGKISTKVDNKDTTFNNLFRRPKHQLNIGIGYAINKKIYTNIAIKSLGKRTDRYYNADIFDTENVLLKAYTTLDLYGEYKINSKIKVYFDLKNLTNTSYNDAYGYSTKKLNYVAGMLLNF
jgi:vitamin B12 transporter